jgi:hypothetical protein
MIRASRPIFVVLPHVICPFLPSLGRGETRLSCKELGTISMYENLDPRAALAAVREALTKAMPAGDLQKAWTQSSSATTGLTMYSLEAPAKLLYPVITPLRNTIPRVSGGMGIQANWKAITAINTTDVSIGVSEGNRGQVQSTTVTDYNAAFKTLGIEDYVTFEADLAAQGFDDVKARAVQGNLRALMIGEEKVILGGLGTFGLGTTPTPSLTTSTTGGSLGAGVTVYVRCVALTLEGYMYATANAGVRAQVTRTNADGSTDAFGGGSAQASAVASITTGAGSTNSVSASVTPVRGAVAYAWYWSTTDNTVTTARFHSVTTINSVVIKNAPTGTESLLPAALSTTDYSQNNLVHDGFIAMVGKTGSGALWHTLPTGTPGIGTTLTSDGAGGIVEVDYVLQWFWDNLRMSPTEIYVNSQEMNTLRKRALDGKTTAAQRFVFQTAQGSIVASGAIRAYINQYALDGAVEIPIRLHPNVPPGMMVFISHSIPYSLSGVTDVNRILTRRDYYQIEWPMRSRKYEYGVYTDQVLQCYFIPGQAVLANIAPG